MGRCYEDGLGIDRQDQDLVPVVSRCLIAGQVKDVFWPVHEKDVQFAPDHAFPDTLKPPVVLFGRKQLNAWGVHLVVH